jgi:uncharacterized membrane protein SpoIIM required for sporulation/ABC-type transport system involved in multi-copper enzyme maturation permease subunit
MWNNLRPALIITRREMRDQLRDWRIIIPIIVLTLVFPAIMNFTARQAVDFVARYGAELIGDRLIPFLLMIVGFFPISISLVIALESFVGEKERRSIEPLLSSPLSDWQLYLGKLLAVMVPPLFASYLGIGVYLYGVISQVGWLPEPVLIIQILLLTFVQALVMVSGAVVISTQATSVRAANLLASFIIIPMAFLIQGESLVMFWARYNTLWWVILGEIVLAMVLVRTGVSHFNREELLGRELDNLNLRGNWGLFVDAFKGGASTPVEWLRTAVPESLKALRLPFLLMLGLLLASFWVGASQADDFPIPSEILNLQALQIDSFSRFGSIQLLSANGILTVFLHNLRAMALAVLLGLFSFGVFGVLVVLLPLMLIGYFTATFSAAGMTAVDFLLAFILPHGIMEIPALLLVGAGILFMGAQIVAPSDGMSIGETGIIAFGKWARVLLAVIIPFFALAAVLEVFLTPRIVVWLLG